MTHLVVFNDEHNGEESLMSCDQHQSPAAQLEEALLNISDPCSFAELSLPEDQFSWEPDNRFSTNLTDFLLSDKDAKVEDEASPLSMENSALPSTTGVPAALKMNDFTETHVAPYRQMDLSPRSVVDISNPGLLTQRSPYCIIRSSHSATAAAAAATAAMIVNDDSGLTGVKSCSSFFNRTALPKRPRMSQESESELFSSSSVKTDEDDGDAFNIGSAKTKPSLLRVDCNVSPAKSMKGSSDNVSLKIAKHGVGIDKKSSANRAGSSQLFSEKELSLMERARQCRAEALVRFRKKKAIRSFGRKVRYECRKRIATTRPRVNGRFAKKSDVEAKKSS